MKDKIGELLKKFVPADGTNLGESPMRYMDHSSRYAGEPPASWNAWGGVDSALPHLVNISSDQSYEEWLKTLAHEGTHSKLTIANGKKAIPELTQELRDNVDYLLESDPEFLREYMSHASEVRPYKDIPKEELDERLMERELPAYLQSIEARMPKGQTIEKSKWAKDLFPSEDSIDKYLSKVLPEGYLRNNQSNTFKPLDDKRSIREKARDWLNKMK